MRFDLVTIFPEFFDGPLDFGILRRPREAGLVEVRVHDRREFTHDRHRTVDDRPFGGGEGLVLKPEPLFEAVESLLGRSVGDSAEAATPIPKTASLLLSAAGRLFDQEPARRYAALDRIILLCGRYEGVDERVAQYLATEEVSIGGYVLSGGELPAAVVVDAVTPLPPGASGNEASAANESFSAPPASARASSVGARPPSRAKRRPVVAAKSVVTSHQSPATSPPLLDFPHYTRPADFRGWKVPEILISGNHAEVAKWRRQAALEKTRRNRPDLSSS